MIIPFITSSTATPSAGNDGDTIGSRCRAGKTHGARLKKMAAWMKKGASGALLTALALGVLTLGACSSNPSRKGSETPAQTVSLTARFNDIVTRQKPWTSLQVPVKIKMSSPAGFSISGRAYMERGKRIYLSLRMLGIEIATADIEGDSVWVADKYHKRLVAEDIKSLMGGADITVADIQDLMLGRVFINGEGDLNSKSIKKVILSENGASWTMTPKKKIHGVGYRFTFDTDGNSLKGLSVATSGNVVNALYDNQFATPYGDFMQLIRVTGNAGKQKLDAKFTNTMKSAKWNVKMPVRQDFSGYERINATKLLKSLKF